MGIIAYLVSSIFSKFSKGVNLPTSSSSWVSVKLDARALEVVLIFGLFLWTVGLFLRTIVVQNSINFFTDGWQLERSARFVQVLNVGPEGDQLRSFRNETALNQFPEIKLRYLIHETYENDLFYLTPSSYALAENLNLNQPQFVLNKWHDNLY